LIRQGHRNPCASLRRILAARLMDCLTSGSG
jgi:hypothetical protein